MRKFLSLLVLFLLPLAAIAGKDYDAGIDYEVLPQAVPTSAPEGKVEVAEFFWYGCPHCYRFEPHIREWLEHKPEAAYFVRIPAVLNPKWKPHAEAWYAAEALGVTDKLHDALFEALHEQRRRIYSPDQIARFVASLGIDEQKFRETMNSFLVQSQVRRAIELGLRARVHGVPSVLVAGKYLVTGERAGSYEEMINIVNHLVEKEAGKAQR